HRARPRALRPRSPRRVGKIALAILPTRFVSSSSTTRRRIPAMGGQPTQTTQTSQQSSTQPWTPAQPALQGLLGKLGDVDTSVTPAQASAASALGTAAGSLPDFAPQLTATASKLMSGGPDYSGVVSGAYGGLQSALAPYLGASYLDPRSTPGLSDALGAL